jgi:hypothetical protein
MLGVYENFPQIIHLTELFTYTIPSATLQQKIVQVLQGTNRKTLSFEAVAIPTVPNCDVIFEWGIADGDGFTYVDGEQAQKVLNAVRQKPLRVIDLFCSIRYYRNAPEKRQPLKFDYYMMRMEFEKKTMIIQVFHERGPRYISPEDTTAFLIRKVNESSKKKILQPIEAT